MGWFDENFNNVKEYTGETFAEALATHMRGTTREERLASPEFARNACLIIEFNTELVMEGIFTLLENSIGQYMWDIIQAFRVIGDDNDADVLTEICRLAPPEQMRAEFLKSGYLEYE